MPKEAKIDGYNGLGCSFSGRSASGRRRRRLGPHQMEFASIQQFPLDGFATFQAKGGGQSHPGCQSSLLTLFVYLCQ